MSLISISQKKTCSHIKCVQRYFRSEAGNLKVCYRMQVRENSVNEDHHVMVQILLSNCEAKRDIVTESSGIWLVQGEERFGLRCLN